MASISSQAVTARFQAVSQQKNKVERSNATSNLSARSGVRGTRLALSTQKHHRGLTSSQTPCRAEAAESVAAPEDVDSRVSLLDRDGSLLASSTFPIKPDDLIIKTKEFLAANLGCNNPDLMADDFTCTLPAVGPLNKEPFIKVFGGFKIRDSFPDFEENYFGFVVDPAEPNRCWFMSRSKGTNTKELWNGLPASNKEVEVVPTVSSCIFNEEGKVAHFSTGYPMDRDVGNTGGLSAAFGLIYALKPGFLPFPEAQPYKRSWQMSLFIALGGAAFRVIGRK